MPHLPSLPDDAGPPALFKRYPDIYAPWAQMSEALMNGPSSFSQGEREMLLAFAAGAAGCDFVCVAHAEVAYAWGIERGLVARWLDDHDSAGPRWRPLLDLVATLAATPADVGQAHIGAVVTAGWDEQAVHDAVAITARAAFMQRLVQGFGFATPTHDVAARHAGKRVERGYVNLYGTFRDRT